MSSGRSSPVNGGFESAGSETTGRVSVRKDLFPEVRLSKLVSEDDSTTFEDFDEVSCVNLKTDFEQSIDEIQKQQSVNGLAPLSVSSRHKKHKQHTHINSESDTTLNGYLPTETKRKKSSPRESHRKHSHKSVSSKVKGGKNLNLVSSSEFKDVKKKNVVMDNEDTSEDEVLKSSVKLPIISVKRASGKPYSHELSQLSNKKSKSKDSSKEKRTHYVQPCSGKPRSMLDICSSSKKKSKKSEHTVTYQSSIVDSNTNLKIKIRRTSRHAAVAPVPIPVSDIGQKKSKKKRIRSPASSESSGEEYDPSRGDTAAVITVAAPKSRQPVRTTKKSVKPAKHKGKSDKTEKLRVSAMAAKDLGPQSPWAQTMPEEILVKIFEHVVHSEGSLPSVIRLGRVCKLWHSVSCRAELWRVMDLAQYTLEKWKTDYKLVWLLENRLTQCRTLNIGHWKVCNVPWVLACVADYCPGLTEIGVAGWSRLLPDQLFELFQSLPNLQRIDLSQTSEVGGSGTCLSAASVSRLVENFGGRITHLTLANNKFSGLQQILTSIATHCPNLEVLDLSGATVTSHPGAVPLEALQKGCPKVRVFRAANAQLVLSSSTTAQQMEAHGWSRLEELSIAGVGEGGAAEEAALGRYRLGDEALARLVRGATSLRLLDLRGLASLSDSGLVRVPAWDLQHLFLGGCNVTKKSNACLELICEKWSHSLIELDLSWASAARALDDAVSALADATDSKLRTLNLCGSSVALEPVKKVLRKCLRVESINLSSCRSLPRGMKRLFVGKELQDLKDSFDPEKIKAKEEAEKQKSNKKNKNESNKVGSSTPAQSVSNSVQTKVDSKTIFQEPKSAPSDPRQSDILDKASPRAKDLSDNLKSPSTPKLLSPAVQSKPDSSSTPRSDTYKTDLGSPRFSPLSKPDSQVQNSPDVPSDMLKGNSWSLGQFKTTPSHKSEASPLNKSEGNAMNKPGKAIEQCSPTTSQDNRPSPETLGYKQENIKTPNSYYGGYSPMTRQENQFSQRSPYSAQPSPAQPLASPYSAQPSPYSTQPSPYSSQPSPYSAQPSPDTSQIVKQDMQKPNAAWNSGNYSPMPKHPAPYSPHPSPEAVGKGGGAGRTPSGQYPTPFSPHPSPESGGKLPTPGRTPGTQYPSPYSPRGGKKSPAAYSALLRPDCLQPPPAEPPRVDRTALPDARHLDHYPRPAAASANKPQDLLQGMPLPDMSANWGMDRFNRLSGINVNNMNDPMSWRTSYQSERGTREITHDSQPQPWSHLPPFEHPQRRIEEDLMDPWTLGQFRMEPPNQGNYVEQAVNFEQLSAHIAQSPQLQSFIEENFPETSRVD